MTHFGTVGGAVMSAHVPRRDLGGIRKDLCDAMGVPDTYLCVNQGRIVDNLDDVDGDLILLANPDFSFMAQEVCAAVNRGLNNLFMTIDGVGAICVDPRVLYSLRYHLKGRRVLVISLASLMTSMKPDVVITLRPSKEMLDGHHETASSFYKTVVRVLTHYSSKDVIPCVVSCISPPSTSLFIQPLPWSTACLCDCCGALTCHKV